MIDIYQHTAFTPEPRPVPRWMHDPADYIHPRRLLQPLDDVALTPTWHLLDESLCPLCGEILDSSECPHDWAAIAAVEQSGTPEIELKLPGR